MPAAANRMARGYARLRQWLILAFRMAAIGALVFAISRPLASGWLGLAAGGRPDTTIIVLDRSPSMQERGAGSTGSKLETGRQQLARALRTLSVRQVALVESYGIVGASGHHVRVRQPGECRHGARVLGTEHLLGICER